MLKIYYSSNFTNTPKESYFLIWEAKPKIWVSYFLGCPFYWPAQSGRFNYAWLNEVSIWSNLKLFEKIIFSSRESQHSNRLSHVPQTLHQLHGRSGLLDQPATKLTTAARRWAFLHLLLRFPQLRGDSKHLRWEPSGVTWILPGQQDAI